jgi:VanZ family protein
LTDALTDAAEAITGLADVADAAQRGTRPDNAPGETHRAKHTRELFWHYWLPVLIMLSLIAVESTEMMSGAHTGHMLGRLVAWLGHPLPEQAIERLNFVLRKCGHVVGYGLLCASWLLLLRGSYWLRHEYQLLIRRGLQIERIWWRPVWGAVAVFATSFVASADEFHQMSLPGRTGAWHDIALDSCAAFAAMLLFRAKALGHCEFRT